MRHDPGLHEGPVCGINLEVEGSGKRLSGVVRGGRTTSGSLAQSQGKRASSAARRRASRQPRRRLAPRSINKYLLVLHAIFRRAQRQWGLTVNPAAGVERQPVRRSGDFRVLSPEQV